MQSAVLEPCDWKILEMDAPSPSNTVSHKPVLVREVLEYLAPRPGAVIVDATAGSGGHSASILPRLLPGGRLIAVDRDPNALALARRRLAPFGDQVTFVQGDFRTLQTILEDLGLQRVDGILADLGVSSLQLDNAERGFSFSKPGPLDMRMDPSQPLTARLMVNEWSAEDLAQVFRTLGEERLASRIARRIAQARERQEINDTDELARIVAQAYPAPARFGRIHPATRTFQALRMAVNDELGALTALLGSLEGLLNTNGRAVVISFHSLEDRLVKHTYLSGKRHDIWTVLTKKPVRPSPEEVADNPRARSAKLRAVERRPLVALLAAQSGDGF